MGSKWLMRTQFVRNVIASAAWQSRRDPGGFSGSEIAPSLRFSR